MTSTYPENYDEFSAKIDNISDAKATDINAVQESIVAVQTTLGLNVEGNTGLSGWTLADRLNVALNANGTFKENILDSSDIPSNSITNIKMYNPDTFEMQSVKIGLGVDGSYGYTGQGPGANAGVTIDSTGNVWIDGNLNILGSQSTATSESITQNLIVNGSSYLGDDANDILQFTGKILPSITSKYDIGSNSLRIRTAYIDAVVGQTTGGNTLTVGVSANFDSTVNIKSSVDSSTGDTIGFVGIYSDDLAIQSGHNDDLRLQPYEGNLKFRDTYINDDIYNFYLQYPASTSELQQFICEKSTITSISTSIDTRTTPGLNANITIDGSTVLTAGGTYTLEDITSTFTTVDTYTQNINALKGSVLTLSLTAGTSGAENFRVQVRARRY